MTSAVAGRWQVTILAEVWRFGVQTAISTLRIRW